MQDGLFYLWWTLVNGFLYFAEFSFLLRMTHKQDQSKGLCFLYVGLNCLLTVLVLYVQLSSLLRGLLHMGLLFVFAVVFLKCKPLRLVAPMSVIFALFTFMDGISSVLMRLLVTVVPTPQLGYMTHAVLTVVLALAFYAALRSIAARYQAMAQKEMASYLYLLLLPCAFVVWVTRFALGLDQTAGETSNSLFAGDAFVWGFVCIVGACATFFVILQLFSKIVQLSNQETERALLRDQLREQQRYLAEAKQRHAQARAFSHDINNHMSVLSGLLRAQDYAGAVAYFEKLNVASGALLSQIATGHAVLDILLSEKVRYAAQHQIDIAHAVYLPAHLLIDDLDLCVVFANLLDNAIKACLQLCPEKRNIQLTARVRHQFLWLDICNPKPDSAPIVWGTGLRNTKQIVEKYQGSMEIAAPKDLFRVSLLLCWEQETGKPPAQPE